MISDAWNEGVSDVWNFTVNAVDEKFMQHFSFGNLKGKESCKTGTDGATILKWIVGM